MKLKDDSVKIDNLHPLLKSKLDFIDDIFKEFGEELVITSGHEDIPVHKTDSKHYPHNNLSGYGQAIDIRNYIIPGNIYQDTLKKIEYYCPRPQYKLLDEGDHLHLGLYEETIRPLIPRRRVKEPKVELDDKVFKTIKLGKIKIPFLYKFKRAIGITLTVIGKGVSVWEPVVGNLIESVGTSVAAMGLAHSVVKSPKLGRKDDIPDTIVQIVKLLWNLIRKLIGKK